jgi:hypothetical protein
VPRNARRAQEETRMTSAVIERLVAPATAPRFAWPPGRPLLTAEWRHLAMLNFEVDPCILQPYVPAGTELDEWRGIVYASIDNAPLMAAATIAKFSEQGGGGWNWILSDLKSLLETGKTLA